MSTFDVTSIKNRIITSLRKSKAWSTILPNSASFRLIDAVAEEIAYLALYDEYLTREQKWNLARNRSSLISQSDIFKYTPARKTGANGQVKVSISQYINNDDWNTLTTYATDDYTVYNDLIYKSLQDSNTGNQPDTSPTYWQYQDVSPTKNISIPRFTIFSTDDDIQFTNTSASTLTTADQYKYIDIIQGIPNSDNFTALGNVFEEIEIDNDSIENTFLEVYVNNILWTKVDNIYSADENEKKYEVFNKPDASGIIIKFGNGSYGLKLSTGDVVNIKYLETQGYDGNVNETNQIINVNSNIQNVDGETITLYVTNTDVVTGGLEREGLESIRANAPLYFQAGDRATTKNDYKTIIEAQSNVSKAVAWGVNEVNEDNNDDPWTFVDSEENVVHVAALNTAYNTLSNAEKLIVATAINENKSPTDIVQFEDVVKVLLVFQGTIYVSNSIYTLAEVKQNVLDELEATYEIENINFEQNLYYSDYQALIDNTTGVDYHDTVAKFSTYPSFSSAYIAQATLRLNPVTTSSIQVYVEDTTGSEGYKLIGTDDGAGGFVAESGYTLGGSSVNYTTGVCVINVASGLSGTYTDYNIKIVHSHTSNNLLLSNRYEIFDLDLTETTNRITAQYR